jgi:hypothetical protein
MKNQRVNKIGQVLLSQYFKSFVKQDILCPSALTSKIQANEKSNGIYLLKLNKLDKVLYMNDILKSVQ